MEDHATPRPDPATPASPLALPDAPKDTEKLTVAIVNAAWAKNAYDTRILDVSETSSFTDVFVIMTGRSDRHVGAISAAVEKDLKTKGHLPEGVEGRQAATWILLDYGHIVVHLFEKTMREFYDLESLWTDARVIPVEEPQWVQDFARMEAEGDPY